MRVKCIYNKGIKISKDFDFLNTGFNEQTRFDVVEGKEYIVYGMNLWLGFVWYFICDETYTYFPRNSPATLFQVMDNRMSRYWRFACKIGETYRTTNIEWNYPEWINEPHYVDLLTDGEEREKEIFRYYKAKMDIEFPNPAVSAKAEIGDEQWLYCPLCNNAWISERKDDGMVICSECNGLLHNPRYQERTEFFSEKDLIDETI